MRARARIVTELDRSGRSRLVELHDAAPIGLRPGRDCVYLVATAQPLVGDDDLELDLVVGRGSTLRVHGVSDHIAYASRSAHLTVRAEVAASGLLDWRPGALIATARCCTTTRALISLERGASLAWTDESVLGRLAEEPGDLDQSISVEVGGQPLLRHRLAVGPGSPGWESAAVLGQHRAAGFRVIVGGPRAVERRGEGFAVLSLEGPGVVVSALGRDLDEMRQRLACAGVDFAAHGATPRQGCEGPRGTRASSVASTVRPRSWP